MAKDKKKEKNNKKTYRNPLKTIWGKALIVIMSLLMVASILLSLGYLMYRAFNNV